MLKRIPLVLLFLTYSSLLFSQEYLRSVRHFNLEKGLETRDIRYAIKDSEGFMWFTSEYGAYRFDGYEFKNFKRKTNRNEPYSMDRLVEDAEKNIWFFHSKIGNDAADISILLYGRDSLVAFDKLFENNLTLPTGQLANVSFGQPHFVGLVFDDGQIYEYTKGQFIKIFKIPRQGSLEFFSKSLNNIGLVKGLDETYWIVYRKELIHLSAAREIIKKEKLPIGPSQIRMDEKGRLWLKDRTSFYLKEAADTPLQLSNISLKADDNNPFYHIPNDSPSYLLTTNSNSIYDLSLINLESEEEIKIEPFGEFETNISPNNYFIENKNSIWLTTHEGIYHIQLNKKVFKNYIQGTSTREIIRGEEDDLWVTSNLGFHKINLEEETVVENKTTAWRYGRALLWENAEELWLGKLHHEIEKVNPEKFEILQDYELIFPLPAVADLNTLHRDKKTNQLWVGTTSGLYKYDEAQDSFIIYENNNGFDDFDLVFIDDIFENEAFLLFATAKGVFQFHPTKGVTHHFSTKDNSLPYDNIVFIHQDKVDSTFWLGTKLGGLIHWDKKNDSSKVFTTEDGLSDNLIYAVYEDDDGFLWLPSNMGLMRFNKKTKEATTFTTQDGLPYDEFNFYSHHQDKDGNLYFGGLNGITVFNPKDLSLERVNNPLRLVNLEEMEINGGEWISHWEDFQKNQKITLSAFNKVFRATVSLLDYKNPEGNQFRYKLEGFEEEWKEVEGNKISINSLPYGNFSLQIKAKNSNGLWSNQQLYIPIQVLKPFYLKWWFFFAVALSLIGIVGLLVKRRTRVLEAEKEKLEQEVARRTHEIQQQAEELQKLDEIKTRFFANVTHELRTPLTLIISPLKQLMKTTTLDDKTLRTLTAIAQSGEQLKNLVEEILDLSRYDANKLKLRKKSVHFLQEVRNWATGFDLEAEHREIDFQVDYQLPIDLHLQVDAKKLEKIATNLLSNAFKYSRSGDSIILKVSEYNDKVCLRVIDTGQGIHPRDLPHIFERFFQSKQTDTQLHGGLGIGLALSKELSKMMGGQLSVISELGEGSTFTLYFPREEVEDTLVQDEKKLVTIIDDDEKLLKSIEPKGKYNILIVEDNLAMQAFIQELLHPFSNTILANNGKDALRILENEKANIQLIISDVMMPEMDGFTLLEKLKKEERWQLIPIIMLTALGEISKKLEAITIGVDDYLVKPFEPDELVVRVKNLIQNVKLREKTTVVVGEEGLGKELPELESADLKWLKKLEEVAFAKITEPKFSVAQLAFEMAIGERQFSRNLKKLTGLTPGNYLKEIKLQKARQLLENKVFGTVAEVSYAVGFSTPAYFSTLFKKRFGKLPSEYSIEV